MLEVLTNPNRFFEAKAKGEREEKGAGGGEGKGGGEGEWGRGEREPSLKIPALIVLTSGLVGGISLFLMAGVTFEMLRKSQTLPQEALGVVSAVGGVGAFVGAVVSSFVIWVVAAALFFAVSCLFKGEGKFKRTLEFVGYGYIPTIFSGLVSAVLVYNFVSTTQIPVVTNVADPAEIQKALAPLLTSPLLRLSSAVGILFMLWSANIWIFGLKHARNLSTRDAVLTVAIPVAIYILVLLLRNPSSLGV